MKIKTLSIIFVLLVSIISCIALSPVSAAPQTAPNTAAVSVNKPVANAKQEVLEARFLNMLNHNFVYGDDFKFIDEIVNLSVIALLDSADILNGEFIKESDVFSFIFDMYGIEVLDAGEINADFPKKEGYIYIVPRGFTVYKHSNAQIKVNEDGSFSVSTDVSVNAHDAEEETFKAVSLFVKNSDSSFGYSLISSEIFETAVQM